MKRRSFNFAALCASAMMPVAALAASLPPEEQARVDKLIQAVSQHQGVRFIRNGSEYTCAEAAEFLRGKLKWSRAELKTVHDFIELVGTKSTSSGEIYKVRLTDGRTIPSGEFLRLELVRIERK